MSFLTDSYCTDEGEIRLRGGAAKEGRVEICLNNTWGTLCSSSWGDTEASVACQQLGYSGNCNFSVVPFTSVPYVKNVLDSMFVMII